MKFKHAVVGGTFDILHKGHKNFLTEALSGASRVTVGIASDEMAKSRGKLTLQKFSQRQSNVIKFIKQLQPFSAWRAIEIEDIFGTADKDSSVDAVYITEDSLGGALEINRKREALGLKPLQIVKVPLTLSSDDKKPISSFRIRSGEISPDGFNYFLFLSSFNKFVIPENLRNVFALPQGVLHQKIEETTSKKDFKKVKLVSVGDQITYNLIAKGIQPILSIVDFKIQREKKFNKIGDLGFDESKDFVLTKNPAGVITSNLVGTIHESLKQKSTPSIIVVEGEEDLSVLPVTLMAPLGFMVLYGLRSQGFVAVNVDLETKGRFLSLLKRFKKVV